MTGDLDYVFCSGLKYTKVEWGVTPLQEPTQFLIFEDKPLKVTEWYKRYDQERTSLLKVAKAYLDSSRAAIALQLNFSVASGAEAAKCGLHLQKICKVCCNELKCFLCFIALLRSWCEDVRCM